MKKLINVFFVAAGLMFAANVANAQQKIGHINSDEVFATYPAAQSASEQLEALNKTKEAEIDKMIAEAQSKQKALIEKQRTLSEANKATVEKELMAGQTELQDLAKRIDDARKKAQQELQTKQSELFPPLQRKVSEAITAVAKEKGLSYVFDASISQGFNSMVFSEPTNDITAAVKAKLGISATASTPVKPAATAKPAPKK